LGTGYAAVLFGDYAPTGRLPISLPATIHDTIEPCGYKEPCVYSEGMATSYRNRGFNVAYPFGHGLTFTEFNFSNVQEVSCPTKLCIQTHVTNVGAASGVAVPQLYLGFPGEAGYPTPVLKGFTKTKVLAPGESDDVVFQLTVRDVSYWEAGDWIQASGVMAQVSASSMDVRSYKWINIPSAQDVVV